MITLKKSLIAVSTLLLSVGIFTSCSDDDGDGDYLSCDEAFAKQIELIEVISTTCVPNCGEPTDPNYAECIEEYDSDDDEICVRDIYKKSGMCGGASYEECMQHYKNNCTIEEPGLVLNHPNSKPLCFLSADKPYRINIAAQI